MTESDMFSNMCHASETYPSAIDLFSGCGGLTLGLKQAGFKVLAAVEIDPRARAVYQQNHPEVFIAGNDIRQMKPLQLLSNLRLQPGELDLLAGCPPCQGFSRIRRRNRAGAQRDDRNTLIDDFGRFVEAFLPKSFMMENVPALAEYKRFHKLVAHFRRLGYKVHIEVLDVADFGVAQRRKRLIVAGGREVLPKLAQPSSRACTVRDVIGNLPVPGLSGDPLHDLPERRSPRVKAIIEMIPKDGGGRRDLDPSLRLKCHSKVDGFYDVYGRMAWDRHAPTITSGCTNPSKGRFIHPQQNRAITLREASLLQGFPISYDFDHTIGKEALALMIGNALPPPFIAKHARAIFGSLT